MSTSTDSNVHGVEVRSTFVMMTVSVFEEPRIRLLVTKSALEVSDATKTQASWKRGVESGLSAHIVIDGEVPVMAWKSTWYALKEEELGAAMFAGGDSKLRAV